MQTNHNQETFSSLRSFFPFAFFLFPFALSPLSVASAKEHRILPQPSPLPKPFLTFAFLLFTFALLFTSCTNQQPQTIDLSGEWQFQIDPKDQGENGRWFSGDLSETIQLPGSMVENGKGYDITMETEWTGLVKNKNWTEDPNYAPYHDPDNIRFPFWLQPEKKYTGAAWFRKKVVIPEKWEEKTILLNLERPHWETTVWVNGVKTGSKNYLGTPHQYDITQYLFVGENTLTIRTDNRVKEVDVGRNSHSISDHTQSNWNGIVGDIFLEAKSSLYFEDVRVYPEVESKTAQITATVQNYFLEEKTIDVQLEAQLKKTGEAVKKKTHSFTVQPGENIVKMSYPLGEDALLWDEFHPNVYELNIALKHKKGWDQRTIDFGMREFRVDGTHFTINGRPVFLRGTLECAIFPKTGYPPTDVESWIKVYRAVQAHGLNHVRFHSWCPPKAAFEAADEMGIYLQVECSSWANATTTIGDGKPIDNFIWEESKSIVQHYGNHPSFVMLAYGNEPGGPNQRQFLTEFVSWWKEKDDRRLYTGAAGWPAIEANDYHNLPRPRIQGWGEQLRSVINAQPPRSDYDWSEKVHEDGYPVVSHEIGQWCVYPNFKEIEKYTGPLKARNFELFRESLHANHMGHLADSFLWASGKLQALCYKADIEAALRTPGFAGFQLLDLHDFPGQGTALVGVLDPFWEEKGYITPEEYKRFCNATVPLVRLSKRIFTEEDTLVAPVEIAHFGTNPLEDVNPSYNITQGEKVISEGTFGNRAIPIGNSVSIGNIMHQFQTTGTPRKLTIEVAVENFSNSWDIWVYPKNSDPDDSGILVVENITSEVKRHLDNGGKVLLSLGRGKVTPEMGGDIGVGFSSIFWNTAWTDGQKPHTLGILCDPAHPALELFPTEYHSNWQWWDAMSHSDAIKLNDFPVELKPIVRIIDDWVSNRRLALLFEAQAGNGKILVSGADLVNNLQSRPEARQLKASLIRYMTGEGFNPAVPLTPDEIQKILK